MKSFSILKDVTGIFTPAASLRDEHSFTSPCAEIALFVKRPISKSFRQFHHFEAAFRASHIWLVIIARISPISFTYDINISTRE